MLDPVVVRGLTKTYPNGVKAVRGISFDVLGGEVFGLLGPNGAGKTTTLGVLTTLVRPSGGTALVGGFDVVGDPVAARGSIGVVFQDSVLDNEFSGEANLRLHARLWRVPDADARIAALLDAVGLAQRASDSVRTYSGGMRRRLEIARALLGRPSVLTALPPRPTRRIISGCHLAANYRLCGDVAALVDPAIAVQLHLGHGACIAFERRGNPRLTRVLTVCERAPGRLFRTKTLAVCRPGLGIPEFGIGCSGIAGLEVRDQPVVFFEQPQRFPNNFARRIRLMITCSLADNSTGGSHWTGRMVFCLPFSAFSSSRPCL